MPFSPSKTHMHRVSVSQIFIRVLFFSILHRAFWFITTLGALGFGMASAAPNARGAKLIAGILIKTCETLDYPLEWLASYNKIDSPGAFEMPWLAAVWSLVVGMFLRAFSLLWSRKTNKDG